MTETPPPSSDFPSPDAATGADSLWSAPASLAPNPALLQQVGYLTAEPKHDCVLLGPAGAGKSSLLSVLGRACQQEQREGLKVVVFPGAALTELAGDAARFAAGNATAMGRTAEPASYDFQLTIEAQTAVPLQLEVIAQDLPGGEIFGPPGSDPPALKRSARAKLWLQAARRASCLILCIDAMQPERLRWEILLPQLIEELAVSSGRLVARLSRLGQSDVPPMLSPKRQLPFNKILVLLTKIDQVCAAVASATAAKGLTSRPLSPFLSRLARRPREFAAQLDPVRLAADRLGEAFLGQLRAAAAPDTRLAVGLVSAYGFGTSITSGASTVQPREVKDLEAWLPFGIWESLLFLATGDALQPVKALPPATSIRPEPSHSISLPVGGHR